MIINKYANEEQLLPVVHRPRFSTHL